MKTLEEMVKELPPELREEVEDFVEFLLEKRKPKPKGKFKFDWEGALADMRDQYTSVELQHKILEWWGDWEFTRVTVNPNQLGGVPCIRGLRIPVATVVGMVADGMTEEEILKAFPDLEGEDIVEALRYAAEAVRERELPLVTAP
jgi:uncharacterized protein (DUF433 family)